MSEPVWKPWGGTYHGMVTRVGRTTVIVDCNGPTTWWWRIMRDGYDYFDFEKTEDAAKQVGLQKAQELEAKHGLE